MGIKLRRLALMPLLITGSAFAIYCLLWVVFFRSLGEAVGAFAVIPVIAAAWYWGMKGGVLMAIIGFSINTLLSAYLTGGHLTLNTISRPGAVPGTLALILIGIIVGRLTDLQKRVRQEFSQRLEAQGQLDKSKQLFEGVFSAAMDAIIIIDDDHRIVLFNAAAEKLFGYPSASVIGRNLNQLIPDRFRSIHKQHIQKFADVGTTRRSMAWPEIATGLRADGTEFLAEATISRFETRGEKYLAVSMRDVTEREKALRRLKESEERFANFMNNALVEAWIKDERFKYAYVNSAVERMLAKDKESILGKTDFDFRPKPTAQEMRKNDETVLSRNQELETYEVVPDAEGVPRNYHVFKFPFQDSLGVRFIGGVAVDVTELKKREKEILTAHDAAVEGWAHALDLRDKEVKGHADRVAYVAVELAKIMGLSSSGLEHIRRGALLHDIGKIALPDSILFKQGELSSEEWQIMRKHPQYAFEMLYQIQFLRPAIDIPYCHHERWDGKGYPRGLKGDQIPLAARIFAVADVWDALLSDRPYRKAWSEEKAIRHIKETAGSHFDPRVAGTFLANLDRIKHGTSSLRLDYIIQDPLSD